MQSTDTIFEGFNRLNVLIVGDVMIDRYLYGRVGRISPEAPVPVVNWQNSEDRLGGAANVALNVRALGANPYLFSIVGQDEHYDNFGRLMQNAGLDTRGILPSGERMCTVKTRVIAQNQHLLRVDREHTHDLTATEAEMLLQAIEQLLSETRIDVIIFQDYNKGVLSPAVIEAVLRSAKTHHIPTVVDPKFRNFWAFRGVTLFKPNLREIRDQLSFPVVAERGSLRAAAAAIREQLNNEITLITLSDKGLYIAEKEAESLIPTQSRSIADVCGAGDTVISVVALTLALGLPLETIGQLANLAGGQVCEKVGVAPVDKEQLRQEYGRCPVPG